MIKIKFHLPLCLIAFILISCDPTHYINFVNETKTDIKVKFKLTESEKNYSHKISEVVSGDSIVFIVKQDSLYNLHFGIGNWSESTIDKFVNTLKYLEIDKGEVKTIYKTQKAIKNLLMENRSGFFFKTKIEIKLK